MITSVRHTLVKHWAKYQQKKYRDLDQKLVVEGPHLVELALEHTRVEAILTLTPNPAYPQALLVSEHVMKKITSHTPPIAAVIEKPSPQGGEQKVLLLDRVQDPGNLGTLMRSALAFGFDRMVLYQCVDPFGAKVVRATQGALFRLPVDVLDSPEALSLRFPNHRILAAMLKGKTHGSLTPPFILMLGNEGQGLSDAFLKQAHHHLTIQTHEVESLNVAVAGSILMHQLTQGLDLSSE